MIVYAIPDDLTGGAVPWLATEPTNAGSLLRSATLLVAFAAGRDPYTDQAPTGAEADALRDATCAQVAAWVTAGIDPTSGAAGEQAPIKKSLLLGDSVEYDTTVQANARAQAISELCGEATAILRITGLLREAFPLFDSSGALPTWGLDSPYTYYLGVDPGWPSLTPPTAAPHAVPHAGSGAPGDSVPNLRAEISDFTAAPGDEVWVSVPDGATVVGTLLPEPAGAHARVKRIDQSTGRLTIVATGGALIDGMSSFPMSPLDAYEFDSDGTNFAIF